MKKHRFFGRTLGGAATLVLALGMFAGPAGAQETHADTSHQMQEMDHGEMHMQPADSMDMGAIMRMMEDPAMRERMMADTAMHRKMMEMMNHMPAEQRERMMRIMHEAEADSAAPAAEAARPATSHTGHQGHTPAMKP